MSGKCVHVILYSSLLRIVHQWTAEQTLLQQLDLTLPWVCIATYTGQQSTYGV